MLLRSTEQQQQGAGESGATYAYKQHQQLHRYISRRQAQLSRAQVAARQTAVVKHNLKTFLFNIVYGLQTSAYRIC